MRIFLAVTTLAIASLIIFWQPDSQILFWQESSPNASALHSGPGSRTVTSQNNNSQDSEEEKSEIEYDGKRDDLVEYFIPDPKAVASMRQARLEGDSRAPNLAPNHEREKPTEDELVDHEQYLEYERRQQKRVYRAYVEASKIKTTQLRSMIEQGKEEGISAEEIAFAEEKIRGIEEMAITLQQDYPDIMEDSYQPPADWLIENLGKDDDSIKTDESTANIAQ